MIQVKQTSGDEKQNSLLKKSFLELRELKAKLKRLEQSKNEPIAIVGLGCRFPHNVHTPDEFWTLLRNGIDGISDIPSDRWDIDASFDPSPEAEGKSYIRHGGFVDNIDSFDADFFNIPPRECKQLDPQHRLLLEVTWETLENAGISPDKIKGTETGVYVGLMNMDYAFRQYEELTPSAIDHYMITGNSSSFLAGRLSHTLGVHGPSMVISTACSSSLVTVHLAVQALRNGECDLALAGGVNVILDPTTNVMLSQMEAIARDGRCKTFDASADGYSRGEGCGMIALKRLSDAQADGDNILALIRGSAVNHDGKSAGLTVPNGLAQERLLRKAAQAAGVSFAEIDYIEAHGTGTALGDPIEIQALNKLIGEKRNTPLLVGSVKTNIGHLEAAAGIAGLIKTVLSLQNKAIPPSLHYKNPSPLIPWETIPLKVVTELSPWPQHPDQETSEPKARIAGVSSFGLSGINAHVILEEAPAHSPEKAASDRSKHLLSMSAHSQDALKELIQRYLSYFDQHPEDSFADICYTNNTGRIHLSHRFALVAENVTEAKKKLLAVTEGTFAQKKPAIAFLFTGQGSQYPGMGRELFETQPSFHQALCRCDEILRPLLDLPLLEILYPSTDEQASLIHQTRYAQPALFSLEYALSELWRSWGIKPTAVIGHSLGEYVAACVAGVFSLEEGLKLVAERGRLMQALPEEGKMTSLSTSEAEVTKAIASSGQGSAVSIAAINGPQSVVISGSIDAVDQVAEQLKKAGVSAQDLEVSHAFHSHLMDPVLTPFTAAMESISFSSPKIRLLSNLTGQPIHETINADYWCRHLRQPVRFADGIRNLKESGIDTFLEIGPKPVLLALGQDCLPEEDPQSAAVTWLPSLRQNRDWIQLLNSLGKLYELGATVDWFAFEKDYAPARQKRRLPNYPFQRKRYWVLNGRTRIDQKNDPIPTPTLTTQTPSLLESLGAASESEHKVIIADALATKVAQVLGYNEVAREPSLLEIGFDSLMAMEIKRWSKRELEVDLDISKFLSNLGVNRLAEELCAQRLIATQPATFTFEKLENETEENIFDLSHGQQALWFMHQNEPGNSAHNVGVALRVFSDISSDELRQVFQLLTDRHPALRTTFSESNGVPSQTVHHSMPVDFEAVDASNWNAEKRRQQVDSAHKQAFDLTHGPLMRVRVFECAPSEKIMLLSFHHIICDNQSVWTLLLEMRDLYAGMKRQQPTQLPALRYNYSHYIHWQNEELSSASGDESWKFWRNQLQGELQPLALQTDHPRPSIQRYKGSCHSTVIDPVLTEKIRKLARKENATLNMVLTAAYQVLLHRYTGQDDILVGIPTAGQNQGLFERVVGYFINTVVLRADLSGNPSFKAFIQQVRQTSVAALAHQDYPFSLLVKQLQPERDPSRSPIIQTRFSLQKAAVFDSELDITQRVEWGDFSLEPFELAGEEGLVDLNMQIVEGQQTLKVNLKYNTDLFEAASITRMVDHFVHLLTQFADHPDQGVSTLPLLSGAERKMILEDWNNTQVDAPLDKCFHQLFEEQVSRTPDKIAVTDQNRSLTYTQLNKRANQLAHQLQKEGVGPEVVVGIFLERSLDLAIAILGVTKAGGAYLPLDPKTPQERLNFILSDSKTHLLLTEKKLSASFTKESLPPEMQLLLLDQDGAIIEQNEMSNPTSRVTSEHLVYIIYTSGSTGKPKGVELLHRGLSNYLTWVVRTFDVGKGTGSPVISSVGFDLTVTSLLPPLLAGNTVHFFKEGDEVEALADVLKAESDLSLIKLTPTHLEMLRHLLPEKKLTSPVRTLVIGGEALSGEQLAYWQLHAPETKLVNHYGPTEAVVGCCFNPIKTVTSGSIPIGKPIDNVQLYILDPYLEPVPVGVVGELFIGGAGVARGYLNRPELNEEKFIKNPFGEGRLFRTGDLAFYRSGGVIEFYGRKDTQVKIRGYRIELSEIQTLLTKHKEVKECVVVAREVQSKDKQLVAYVIPANKTFNADIISLNLRKFATKELPDYMVPSHFVCMESFPLIANGKVDTKALPAPNLNATKNNIAVPRDVMELELIAIWESILQRHPIGIHDSFFDLGGHSILAIRLTAKIQKKFAHNLPLGVLLKNDTVAKLAEHLRKTPTAGAWSPLVAIQPSGDRCPLFCIPGAGGNVIYFHRLAHHLGPNQPFYGLQAAGLDGGTEPHTTVEEMADYYIDAMKKVQANGPYRICGHSLGGWVAFEMAQRLLKQGEEVEFIGIIDTPIPSDQREDRSGWSNAKWIVELTSRIQHLMTAELQVSLEELESLNLEQQLNYFKARLNQANLFPAEVGIDQLKSVLLLFKAQSQVNYFPKDVVPSRISLFRTDASHQNIPAGDETWGWHTLSSVDLYRVPGEHLTVLAEPYVQVLAEEMSKSLTQETVCPL